jgi:phosphopantetheinyl transferase (holo-ACP synthase)
MLQDFTDYLSRLLGHDVKPSAPVTLTSGQQARVAGWLSERGIAPTDLRGRLGVAFLPVAVLDSQVSPGRTAAPQGRPLPPVDGSHPDAERQIDAGHCVDDLPLVIGIDIQRIDEVIPSPALKDPKSSPELTAIFTLREISYAQSRPRPDETLGGLFAAKEALRKCDASLLQRALPEVEVLPDATGCPRYRGFTLSISHSGGFAIAVAARLRGGGR